MLTIALFELVVVVGDGFGFERCVLFVSWVVDECCVLVCLLDYLY